GNLLALHDRTPGSGLPTGTDPVASSTVDALDRAFSYDPLYRLTGATGRETAQAPVPPWSDTPAGTDVTKTQPYLETYGYDLAGNLLSLGHSSASGYTRDFGYAPGSNRLASLTVAGNPFAYSYDAAGNLTGEAGTRRFEWDHANRVATFRTQTGTALPSIYAQYRYDGGGNRVVKVVQRGNGAPDVTIYIDGAFERLTVGAGAASATQHDTLHVLDGPARIGLIRRGDPLPGDPYPTATYHLADHLLSSTAVLDATGVLLNREEYTPYGETSFGSYATKRYRFTGKERDEESGLNYHGARYYAPWLCRWTCPDPAGMVDGPSTYLYVRGNPLGFADPSGLEGKPSGGSRIEEKIHACIEPDKVLPTMLRAGMTPTPEEMKQFGEPYFAKVDKALAAQRAAEKAYRNTLVLSPGGIVATRGELEDAARDRQTAEELKIREGLFFGAISYQAMRNLGVPHGIAFAAGGLINEAFSAAAASSQSRLELPAPPSWVPRVPAGGGGGGGGGGGDTPHEFGPTGYGPNDPPQRIQGPWTRSDLWRGAHGMRPLQLANNLELHHADQLPGSGIHEVEQFYHRGPGSALHLNPSEQGVTDVMRGQDTQLHWWYRSQEMGRDAVPLDWWYTR
ncbi:MAG: RHS repeat-associated core domain-containing protein, partial [Micromonosporaceae bacterium]|nr:RHS repeat-associated core domain-containing protein [Micromonosporaceae bacterium]